MSLKRLKIALLLSVCTLAFVVAGCGPTPGVQTLDGAFKVTMKSPAQITLAAFPQTLAADGKSSSQILATIRNEDGELVSSDVIVTYALSANLGTINFTGNTNVHGIAPNTFVAGTTPGTVTIVVRAGNAVASINLTLVEAVPSRFFMSVNLSPGSTDSLDVAVSVPGTSFQKISGIPVALKVIDINGKELPAVLLPAGGTGVTLTDGTFSARAFLGPLTAAQAKSGVSGFVVATVNTTLQQLAPFVIPANGGGAGGTGGQQAPTFPDSVVFTPSQISFGVKDDSTIAIPFRAQFPFAARGFPAVFSLNPNFGSANAGGITGYFTPQVPTGVSGITQTAIISTDGTASTTLVLSHVRTSQIKSGLVLSVNVTCDAPLQGIPFQFAGSSPVTLLPDSPSLSLIALTANPTAISVPAGAPLSVTVTARVQAQDGSFPQGVFVSFGSDQSRGVLFPTTQATNADGYAVSTFSMDQVPASVLSNGLFITLRASARNRSGAQLSQTTSVFVTPKFGTPDHLVVSSNLRNPTTGTIFVQGSSFPTVAQITFDVLDINDNVARDAVGFVQFVLENGGLHGGENLEPGNGTAPTTGTRILNGRASTTLRAGIRAGTVRVIAFIDSPQGPMHNGQPDPGEPRSEPITISISGGLPSGQNTSIVPSLLNIPGLLLIGLTDQVTAYLADRFNNPVIGGTRVSFQSYDFNTLDSAASVTASTATANGVSLASGILISQAPTPASGFVGVQAQTNAGVDATVLSLVQDPTRTNVVYAGTDGGGVYQGVFDPSNAFHPYGNMAWQNVGTGRTGLANGYVRALAVDPRAGMNGIVYAGTERGLFRSTGSGGIWIARSGRGRLENISTNDRDGAGNQLLVPGFSTPPANPTTYALFRPATGIRARMVVTDNGARRFDAVFDSPNQIRFLRTRGEGIPVPSSLRISYDFSKALPDLVPITSMVVSRNTRGNQTPNEDNAIVYAGTLGAGVFRSTDGGTTWFSINTGLSNLNVLTLALARNPQSQKDVVLLAGTQGGGVFKLAGGDPLNPSSAFRVLDEALITDANAPIQLSWSPANTNLTATHILSMATDDDNTPIGTPFRAYVGTDVGGVFRLKTNNGPSNTNLFDAAASALNWEEPARKVSALNLSNTRVTGIAVNTLNQAVFVATLDDSDPKNPIGGVFRSTDAANNFFPIGSPLAGGAAPLQNTRLHAISMVGTPGRQDLWVGGDGRQVWLSQNSLNPVPANVGFDEAGRIGSLVGINVFVNTPIDNNIYDTTRVLFSGQPVVHITPLDGSATVAAAGSQSFLVTISDLNGNPLPRNTQVCVTSSPKGALSGANGSGCTAPSAGGSAIGVQLGDGQEGGTDFSFTVANDAVAVTDAQGRISGATGISIDVLATVKGPNGATLAAGEDNIGRTLLVQ
ncbi:MAG: hypothetical protein HY303_19875 [Candidatus Wallbacteria bacterium]|nr:hypothetical protein [Candidatus Wallbacteria bacterium]